MTTQEKLKRIHRHGTKYELICQIAGTDKKYLAGYCRVSKMGILEMLRKNGEEWAKRVSPDSLMTFKKNGQGVVLDKFFIEFSGRTQRDAIINGELPWFEELPVYHD